MTGTPIRERVEAELLCLRGGRHWGAWPPQLDFLLSPPSPLSSPLPTLGYTLEDSL